MNFAFVDLPGSPDQSDNHYYFQGSYPSPVGEVAEDEGWKFGFPGFIRKSPLNFYLYLPYLDDHSLDGRVTILVNTTGLSISNDNTHEWIEENVYGTLGIFHNGVSTGLNFEIENRFALHSGSFLMKPPGEFGFNYIELRMIDYGVRDSGSTDPLTPWLSMDMIEVIVEPYYYEDRDQDGLPRSWEEDNLLDDNNPADALLDLDGDGSNNLQEYEDGTFIRARDTDGDGLLDGEEVLSDPLKQDTDDDGVSDYAEVKGSILSDPTKEDSDEDGSYDAWELATGFDPMDPDETPPLFEGAIGINFIVYGPTRNSKVLANQVAGVVPQLNWNNIPLGFEEINNAVFSPATSTGGTSSATVALNIKNAEYYFEETTDYRPSEKLFQPLFKDPVNLAFDTTISVTDIPYSLYDVIVYVSGGSLILTAGDSDGTIIINDDSETAATFRPNPLNIHDMAFQRILPGLHNGQQAGNYIRYSNLSDPSLKIELVHGESEDFGSHNGISAVQIVDMATDTDEDGLPDNWEIEHGLHLHEPGDAGLDIDEDGLSALEEFGRDTDPRLKDTDGDGLSDKVESGSGIYISLEDTGTNPRNPDTDNDRLSDRDEVYSTFVASNPNLYDTDGDGLNDREELEAGTHPLSSPDLRPAFPTVNMQGTEVRWTIDNLQIFTNRTESVSAAIFNIFMSLNERSTEVTVDLSISEDTQSIIPAFTMSGPDFFTHQDFGTYNRHSFGMQLGEPNWEIFGLLNLPIPQLSDRLKFDILFSREDVVENMWILDLSVFNYDLGEIIYEESVSGFIASPEVLSGLLEWSADGETHPKVSTAGNTEVLFSAEPVALHPKWSIYRDNDDDGLLDEWEKAYGYPTDLYNDPLADSDLDGLREYEESLLNLNPSSSDSDMDGIGDREDAFAYGAGNFNLPKYAFADYAIFSRDTDFNNNGLDDIWESSFGFSGIDLLEDSDGDGYPVLEEEKHGTDPFDPDSHPGLTIEQDALDIRLRWSAKRLKPYSFQKTVDFQDWSTSVAGTEFPHESMIVMADPVTGEFPLYRVITQSVDFDGDGIESWAEDLLGLSDETPDTFIGSQSFDSDGDGTPDFELPGDVIQVYESLNDVQLAENGISLEDASRFLTQATFGPTMTSINQVRKQGYESWIDEQIQNVAPSLLFPAVNEYFKDYVSHRLDLSLNDVFSGQRYFVSAWTQSMLTAPDQVRQRVAYALSQIVVISYAEDELATNPRSMAAYYDMLVENAFGNYYDILRHVTFSPLMGVYLSHLGNQKARPEINLFPDENYARELMQLFTIGLWELNEDGTQKLDLQGNPIPSYGLREVTELARVMTGFWISGQAWGETAEIGWNNMNGSRPMIMYPERHDFGEKVLLNGYVIPARVATAENGYKDIENALQHLFYHPNTPVFISKQLIQFMVTDNPSGDYVQRIQNVFVDNGHGVRGDLGAVVKAILLDPEARSLVTAQDDPFFGRLREPSIRLIGLGRAFGVGFEDYFQWIGNNQFHSATYQQPMSSPSRFNFYPPSFTPTGILANNGKVGPVFKITDSISSIALPNLFWEILIESFSEPINEAPKIFLNFGDYLPMEEEHAIIVDRMNLIFCQGQMTSVTRSNILTALGQLANPQPGVVTILAAYLAAISPESAVLR
ncbi:MAG: DUF1800 family protein [Puniceicoccaceae bacterium]